MTDFDHAGAYPFCPNCQRRLRPALFNWRKYWICIVGCGHREPRPRPDDRHREAMRLAGLLEDDE